MTISPAVASALDDLRSRLVQHLSDGTLDLTDDLLGQPLLASLLHTPALTLTEVVLDLSAPDSVTVKGAADVLGASGVRVNLLLSLEENTLSLTAAAGDPVRLSGVLGVVASGVALPPEVPDLGLLSLTASITPHTGAFLLAGACTVPWTLPFGDGLSVEQLSIKLERAGTTGAPVQVTLELSSDTACRIADGFAVTVKDLLFHRGGAGDWTVRGALAAEVLGTAIELSAGLTSTPERREFTFAAETTLAADLAGTGTLTCTGLTVAAGRSTAGEYSWKVEADGSIDLLDQAVVIGGTLGLEGEGRSVTLTLTPLDDGDAAQVAIPLPVASSVGVHLGFNRFALSGGEGAFSADATAFVWFSGLPDEFAAVLPGSRATGVTGAFAVRTGAEAGVSFSVEPVLPRQSFHLPSISAGDFHLDLSQDPSAIEVGKLEIAWERAGGLSLGADFGLGLPAALNQIFGPDDDVFVTYDDTDPDSLVRLKLSAAITGGSPSLRLHPLSSPLKKLVFQEAAAGSDDRQAGVDLGDFGRFSLLVPTLEVRDDALRARGGFTQHGLALPLSPLKRMLDAFGLARVNRYLPDRLPLTDIALYDDVTGLDADGLADLVMGALREVTGIELPDEDVLRDALGQIAACSGMLPERLTPYLNVHIPEELSFDLTVSAEGGLLGGISVAAPDDPAPSRTSAKPLRVLLPGLSAAGPMLTGVELWNLRIGEILGGTALLVTADLNIDQFDLLPLATLMALPADAGLPDPRHLTRRLIAQNVTILVVPETVVPVVVPVFFDDLGIEYRGIEGADFGGHLSLPQPQLNLAAARALYEKFTAFCTDPEARLTPDEVSSHGLDLEFTAGPVYLQLPGYAGGATLGSRTATTSASAADNLASLLNGLKGLVMADLLAGLPAVVRAAPPAPQPHLQVGPLGFTAGWDLNAPSDAPRELSAMVTGSAALGPFAHLITKLGVRTDGVTFTSDSGVGNVIDLHLTGTAGTLPAAGGTPATVLRFADPAARVTTPGPVGQPQHFTIEWWTCPAALRDYNQFISCADVWGSFVFHTTAAGAVYCGTDVNTRLTPDQLPAGTVQLNTWQHFAFTYEPGVGSLYRNGVLLAQKINLTPPAPWTGLRLGIPGAGTQPDGFVADLRVWDVCRSADDINATMRHRLTGAEAGLVGYWPLDDASGATVRDHGPSAFHGSASHTTWTPAGPGTVQTPPPSAAATTTAGAPGFTGGGKLSIFGRTVFSGDLTLAADHATLDGKLDLFPRESGLNVRGNLAGSVDAQHLTLNGNAAVDLAGLKLAKGTIDWTDTRLTLSGKWFDLFDTTLTLDTGKGRVALTGTVSGSRTLDIPFAGVIVHPVAGSVKLADTFHHAATYGFSFTVTADERSGLWAQGHVSCDIDGKGFSVPLSFAAGPASVADLDRMIMSALQGVSVSFFKQLFDDGLAWAKGVADGAIGWARDQAAATGRALVQGYNLAAPAVAQILDDVKFGAGDIGQVLRTTFTAFANDPGGVAVTTLKQAGLDVLKVGDILAGGFPDLVSGDNRDATVQDLTRLMHPHYPALEMVKVGAAAGITAESGTSILKRVGYSSQDLADAAHFGFNLSRDTTVDTLDAIGVPAADIIATVSRSFHAAARDVAKYAYDAGYVGLTELNIILNQLGLPRL